jgi:hypothetical protein
MHVNPTQATTKLRTGLTFNVHDLRGTNGFPKDQGGLVFEHNEKRLIRCKYTGESIKRDARYVIRTAAGEQGWRIDLLPKIGPAEAVYGVTDRATHWPTNEAAAQALVEVLDEIRDNSSLGSL